VDAQLLVNVGQVPVQCGVSDTERRGGVFVRNLPHHAAHHLALTRAQRLALVGCTQAAQAVHGCGLRLGT
jgi:hypothetical protein